MSLRVSNATRAAQAVVEIFDTLKSTRTNFDPVPARTPPDGYLDRGEFPSRHFEKIDRLENADGRIGRDELQIALTRLPAARTADVSARAATAREELLAAGKQARWAIGPFGAGAFLAAGGLLVGGSLGLAVLG